MTEFDIFIDFITHMREKFDLLIKEYNDWPRKAIQRFLFTI